MSSIDIQPMFSNTEEQYQLAKTLVQESNNKDRLHRAKILEKAITVLQGAKSNLRGLKSKDSEINFRARAVYGLLGYEIGMLFLKLKKTSHAEHNFQKAWNVIEGHATKPECIILTISLLTELGLLYSRRNEHAKFIHNLNLAQFYHKKFELAGNLYPASFVDLFVNTEQRSVREHSNLFEGATVTEIFDLGELESLANYLHSTLTEQLKSADCDMVNWSMNCALLSKYFIHNMNFKMARHVLASASQTIMDCEIPGMSEASGNPDNHALTKAYISCCWTIYSYKLLVSSRFKEIKEHTDASVRAGIPDKNAAEWNEAYRLCGSQEWESKVICTLPSNFKEAKTVFIFGLEQLNLCENVFTVNRYPAEYKVLLLAKSMLYGLLAPFENNWDHKCKMYKRQITILENALEKIKSLTDCWMYRELLTTLAALYNNESLRWHYYYEIRRPHLHDIVQFNFFLHKGIEHYELFINSFKMADGHVPEPFPNESVKDILSAYYEMAALYVKMEVNACDTISNLLVVKALLSFMVNYVERNPSHKKIIKDKYESIQKSIALIPEKVEKLQIESILRSLKYLTFSSSPS